MKEADKASKTLDYKFVLNRLAAREDFIAFSRREISRVRWPRCLRRRSWSLGY
jgi:hypothetical protein